MFITFISAGRFIYYISYVAYENKTTILTIYSLYDTSKFAFYVSEQMGIIEAIKNRITYKPSHILVEITGVEESDLGNFEVIDI
jgi:hypothetical protein